MLCRFLFRLIDSFFQFFHLHAHGFRSIKADFLWCAVELCWLAQLRTTSGSDNATAGCPFRFMVFFGAAAAPVTNFTSLYWRGTVDTAEMHSISIRAQMVWLTFVHNLELEWRTFVTNCQDIVTPNDRISRRRSDQRQYCAFSGNQSHHVFSPRLVHMLVPKPHVLWKQPTNITGLQACAWQSTRDCLAHTLDSCGWQDSTACQNPYVFLPKQIAGASSRIPIPSSGLGNTI